MGSRGGASHNTTVNGGGGSVPLSLQFFARKEAIDAQRLIREARLSPNEVAYLQGQLAAVIDANDPAMRVRHELVEAIIDTHFKNQMETHTSQGANAPNIRARLSSEYFGHPYDNPNKVAAGEFEKYGYLAPRDIVTASANASADWYGDVIFRFRREAVLDRTTFKTDDTLNSWNGKDTSHAGSLKTASLSGLSEVSHDTVRRAKNAEQYIHNPDKWVDEVNYGLYFELQYHGNLSIKDVDSVTFGIELPDNLTSLNEMFGTALGDEMLTLTVDLNMDGAKARWEQWAQNPGEITTDAVVYSYMTAENAMIQQPAVNALIDKYTEVEEGADKASLTPEGILAYVSTYAELTNGADTSGLTPENITALVSAYDEAAAGADLSLLTPDEVTALVMEYLEKSGVDTSGLSPDTVTAFVMAYEEITGGASTSTLSPKNVVGIVSKFCQAENIDITSLSPDQIEAIVSKFSEATGCDKSELMQEFVAYITEYKEVNNVKKPKLTMTIGFSGYDLLNYRKWMKQNSVEVEGFVHLSEVYDDTNKVLTEGDVKFWQKGIEIPVSAVTPDMLSPEDICLLDEDGTMHVLLKTEVTGTEEAVEEAKSAFDPKHSGYTKFDEIMLAANGVSVPTLNTYIQDSMSHIVDWENHKDGWRGWMYGDKDDMNNYLQTMFDPVRTAELSTYVAEMSAYVAKGGMLSAEDLGYLRNIQIFTERMTRNGVGKHITDGITEGLAEAGWDTTEEELVAQLDEIIEYGKSSVEERVAMITQKILNGEALDAAEMSYMNSLLTMLQQPDDSLQEAGEETGSSVSEGIIAGMQSAGWDTSAETVASDLESAINQALQINSPSKLMIPVGEYVAMGIEEGAMGYGFTDAGSGMADAMYTAAEQGFYGITWANIGRFAVEGIVRGILSEKDRIIRAMREVSQAALDSARETLDIHSPSRVFRDEVGVMVMRGFGEGISGETKNQARIIRNAARYLTDEAVSGTIAGGTNNSRVYNNSNTISFDGSSFFVRDEQDVYSLAVEIAGLTERQQRGKGSRR